MVVALLALSSVMILGGVAAVVQGFPYVRLESGLAMVIGGSTAASAGVVLLGLTAIVYRLRRLHTAVESLREASPQPSIPAAVPAGVVPWEASAPEAPAFTAPEVSPPERPSLAGMGLAGAGAAGLAGLSIGALRPGARGAEPVFEDPAPSAEPQPSAAEPLLPDLLPEAAPPRASDDDLFRMPEPAHEPERATSFPEPEPVTLPNPVAEERDEARIAAQTPAAEPIGLRSFLDDPAPAPVTETPSEPEAVTPAPQEIAAQETRAQEPEPEASAPEERHAVGSYASGANTYVMFSDGSIEADTPRGRFTFASLDELKTFVNAGGEEARGAA
ncbi:hypothetical protein [Methylorubrum extorquens]|uniref:hypothetical protein n=1 Tax=Methylorubrum extorquens TaxID=408 RepID=UPI00016297FB|nr:hypothetical protein [Methylorubrum extorquens]ABY31686.1 hypothetical protein Mext_3299 [Methylorubrum extorquens PA1]KQP86967.1 hypothetical protein ASF55_11240 [Methylobacterium sp. Leaf119]WIU38310.1 hypothetical protein KQ926_17080 [Methylorubrum extorquens]